MTYSTARGRTFSYCSQLQVPQHLQEKLENVATQGRQGRGEKHKAHTFTLDVPVTEGDVERLGTNLLSHDAAQSQITLNAAFFRGKFFSAMAVLAMSNKAERGAAVHKLAPMRLLDPKKVARVPMTKILGHQRKWLPYRQRLLVYQCRGPILDALLSTQVLALVAPPGSGRTLQLPQIILGNGSFNNKRVIVMCPTSLAAHRTAARLREERGDDEASVTVAVCTSVQYDVMEGTLIAVTTPEMLLRQLLCDPLLLDVCCVVLNDVHVRSPITELCMSLLRDILQLLRKENDVGKRGGPLRVVVDCFEDTVATVISNFFGDDCTVQLNLQRVVKQDISISPSGLCQNSGLWLFPSVLFLEETIQWLEKCEKEGGFVCRDPVDELRNYVENISVQAKILAAGDADFTIDEKLRSYWCPIILRVIQEYDSAERRESEIRRKKGEEDEGEQIRIQLPSIVVVVPNAHVASILTAELSDLVNTITKNEEAFSLNAFELYVLLDSATLEEVNFVLSCGDVARRENKRFVVIATAEVAQFVLPSTMEIGLVVDCGRRFCASYDENNDIDTFVTTYSPVQELRYRRSIARLSYCGGEDEAIGNNNNNNNNSVQTPVCMVVQLIQKSVLYGNQRRRVREDSFYHQIFGMSWDEYVCMYHFLQAREEAARCHESSAYSLSNESSNALSMTVGRIVASNFIGVPAVSSNRYEKLRRIFLAVERHLQRLCHLECVNGNSIPRLLPLGIAATCFAWPNAVLRLLLFSRLEGCVVPASVVAAIWMVGDIFSAGEMDEETRQLMKEARVFFSRDSGSDVVSAFNAYCMWLSSRELSPESEAEFLSESHIPKKFLLRIEAQHLELLRVLEISGIFQSPFPLSHLANNNNCSGHLPTSVKTAAALCVLETQEDVVRDGSSLFRCVTAAAYPRCAVVHNDGTASFFSFFINSAEAMVAASGGGGGEGAAASSARLHTGVFSDNSVLSIKEVFSKYTEKPFLYLSSAIALNKGFSVLECAIPLCMESAVVSCGEWREWPKPQATRCRGWTSVLTNAWRQTKRARLLPPPAQLPPVLIPLKLYDTVQVKHVILQTDDTFFFSMRSTTAKWLWQMREQCRQCLWFLLCDKSLPAFSDALVGFQEAWRWWLTRARNSQMWLREQRANFPAAARVNAENVGSKLYPYYHYSANPGRPEVVVVPQNRHTNAATSSQFHAGGSSGANNDAFASDMLAKPSMVYEGKLPDPVTEKNILEMARSIGKAGSREQETNFLKAYSGLFGFLHPEHEFHGYYLHVLRREAPYIEILGDNLEELEKFLMQIEEEVRSELGVVTTNGGQSYETQHYTADGTDANTFDASATNDPGGHAFYQFQNVNADELKASYGMQMETAAEYATRPPTLFKTHGTLSSGAGVKFDEAAKVTVEEPSPVASFFIQGTVNDSTATTSADPYGTITKPVAAMQLQVDPNASIGNFTFDRGPQKDASCFGETDVNKGTSGNGSVGGSSGGLTLKDRLLAMSGGAQLPLNQPTTLLPGGNPQQGESAALATQILADNIPATVAAGVDPATAFAPCLPLETNPTISASFIGATTAPTEAQFHNAAPSIPLSTAELLAIIGSGPPLAVANPLTTPPPPLPAEVLANRSPSILAYPLPPREFGNVPLILAKALGETMGVKLGPTLIVGDIARIGVPNHKVEARALAIKSFMCVGKKVYIFKNDRIIDPVRPARVHSDKAKIKKGENNALREACSNDKNLEKHDHGQRDSLGLLLREVDYVDDHNLMPFCNEYPNSEQHKGQRPLFDAPLVPNKSTNLPQIGLLTDSDEDDEEEEEIDDEQKNEAKEDSLSCEVQN